MENSLTNNYFLITIKDMERLREKERRGLYDKVTDFIRKKLLYMVKVEGWRGVEIAEHYSFPSNRQSEIKYPKKYPNTRLSHSLLERLMFSGFVGENELSDGLDLNEKERHHMKDLIN